EREQRPAKKVGRKKADQDERDRRDDNTEPRHAEGQISLRVVPRRDERRDIGIDEGYEGVDQVDGDRNRRGHDNARQEIGSQSRERSDFLRRINENGFFAAATGGVVGIGFFKHLSRTDLKNGEKSGR